MIELFVALLLVPASVITIWDLMMHRLAPSARKLTRLTGYIGVPVHELSHALVCVLFGMRITKMAFYGEPAEFGKNRTLRFSGHP